MSVTPTQIPISTSVPALTLAAGTTGGVAAAVSIDPVNDYLLVYTASATATTGINRNTLLGLSSAPVGINDTQTLTAKTLTNPTINAATLSGNIIGTYTLGGTPTFPVSVVLTGATQTLTAKTLSSPTITSPTITNATISTDTITGFTTSTNGTIFGISVTAGVIGSSAITSSSLAAGVVQPQALQSGTGTSWVWTDYSSSVVFTNFTLGNGTAVVRYTQIGKTVHYRGEVTLGTTSSMSGTPQISLPIATTATYNSGNTSDVLGVGGYTRNGVGAYLLSYVWYSTTLIGLFALLASGTYTSLASITSSVPATWSSSDVFTWNVTYEAA